MANNHIIRLKHEGFPCWHIVDVSKLKEPLLKKLNQGEDIDVKALGNVLESGWGKNIPDDIAKTYGVKAIVFSN